MNPNYFEHFSENNCNILMNLEDLKDWRFYSKKAHHYKISSLISIFRNLVHETFREEYSKVLKDDYIEKSRYSKKTMEGILNLENDDDLNQFDGLIFYILKELPMFRSLCNKDFDIYTFTDELQKKINLGEKDKYVFDNDFSPLESVNSFLLHLESVVKECPTGKVLNHIYMEITKMAFSEDNSYHKDNYESFSSMFNPEDTEDEQNTAEIWFFKHPRTSSASHSGYVSMAYWEVINNSDLYALLIQDLKNKHYK